jgi:hypothetical protein
MDIQAMGSFSPIYDRETFGAAVVAKTMDSMHGQSAPEAKPFDRETFGAAVVATTIDYMNTDAGCCRHDNSYGFQMDVLMLAYTGQGTLLDRMV